MRGQLISFEGIDGSGKSTQLRYAAELLQEMGLQVAILREPGGTEISEALRDLLLHTSKSDMAPETELLLFVAARAQLVSERIQPLLESGVHVLMDRFTDSTVAYQGYGRQLGPEWVEALNRCACRGLTADYTFFFDCPLSVARERQVKRGLSKDRMEALDEAFWRRCQEGFHALMSRKSTESRIIRIEAQLDEATVRTWVATELRRIFA